MKTIRTLSNCVIAAAFLWAWQCRSSTFDLLSIPTIGNPSVSGSDDSVSPMISPDGSRIVFTSAARNLTTNAVRGGVLHLYVQEVAMGSTRLVSTNALGKAMNGDSFNPVFFATGAGLAHESEGGNIVTDLGRGTTRAYLDGAALLSSNSLFRPSWRTRIQAAAADGSAIVLEHGFDIQRTYVSSNLLFLVTADGTTTGILTNLSTMTKRRALAVASGGSAVVFSTPETGLVAGDVTTNVNLFTWLRSSGAIERISDDQRPPLNAVITPDGRFLAAIFQGVSSRDVVWWDRVAGTNRAVGAFAASSNSPYANDLFISTNGQRVVFSGAFWDATNSIPTALPDWRMQALSSDGRIVAGLRNTATTMSELWMFNIETGASNAVLRATGPAGVPATDIGGVSLSADGSIVAFHSHDSKIVADDRNNASDVFVAETATGAATLASKSLATLRTGPPIRDAEFSPVLSSTNGRWVGFLTSAALDPTDTNGQTDVYLVDRTAGALLWASAGTNGARPGSGPVTQAGLSENGHYLVFASRATNLTTAIDTNGVDDLFLYDISNRELRLISLSTNGVTTADKASSNAVMTADGGLILFETHASDLSGATNSERRIMAYRPGPGTLERISEPHQAAAGLLTDAYMPSISRDGSVFIYALRSLEKPTVGVIVSGVSGGSTGAVAFVTNYVYTSGPRLPIVPVLSPDGQWMAYSVNYPLGNYVNSLILCGSTGASPLVFSDHSMTPDRRLFSPAFSLAGDLFLRGRAGSPIGTIVAIFHWPTQAVERIYYPYQGNDPSSISISPDGRWLAFVSIVNQIIDGDSNEVLDVFLRDRWTGTTAVLSTDADTGNLPSRGSGNPVFLRDGRTLIFQNSIVDLASFTDQSVSSFHVFNPALISIDSDNDGLDDAWELARFGNLSRDGAGDFDSDGSSDVAEFLAGSDPKSAASKFAPRFAANPGGTRLEWPARPGIGYRVEFKDDLGAASWQPLPSTVTSIGSMASSTDTNSAASTNRFYRIIAVP